MNDSKISDTLGILQKMTDDSGAEINISPEGISLWTSDASDYTCKDVSPEKALKAMKAIKNFRKFWELDI